MQLYLRSWLIQPVVLQSTVLWQDALIPQEALRDRLPARVSVITAITQGAAAARAYAATWLSRSIRMSGLARLAAHGVAARALRGRIVARRGCNADRIVVGWVLRHLDR